MNKTHRQTGKQSGSGSQFLILTVLSIHHAFFSFSCFNKCVLSCTFDQTALRSVCIICKDPTGITTHPMVCRLSLEASLKQTPLKGFSNSAASGSSLTVKLALTEVLLLGIVVKI